MTVPGKITEGLTGRYGMALAFLMGMLLDLVTEMEPIHGAIFVVVLIVLIVIIKILAVKFGVKDEEVKKP